MCRDEERENCEVKQHKGDSARPTDKLQRPYMYKSDRKEDMYGQSAVKNDKTARQRDRRIGITNRIE